MRLVGPILIVPAALWAMAMPPLSAAPAPQPAAPPVGVDLRIELMTVVQLLAGYDPLSKIQSAYRADVLRHFEPWRAHRAVRLFTDMSRGRFRYDAVPRVVLTLGPPPGLERLAPVEASVLRRAGGDRRVDEYASALREFARDSRFADFAAAARPLYDRVEAALAPDVAAAMAPLRAYTGLPLDNCVLIPGLLIHNGGFQATVSHPAGPRVYAIVGPFGEADGAPVFSERGSIAYVAQHEFGHSFVNPLVARHDRELGRSSSLFGPIKADMQKLAYGDWPTTVHEHIVRAIVARLAHARSAAAGERVLVAEEARGFRYVRALADRLQEYEQQRERYPTFPDFFPRLIEVFADLRRRG